MGLRNSTLTPPHPLKRSCFFVNFLIFAALYKQRGTFLTIFSFLLRFTKKEAHFSTFFGPDSAPGPSRGRAPAGPRPGQKNVKKCASFFVKRSKKRKSCQKSASWLVKRSKKGKKCQKSAFLIVKRSKKGKNCQKSAFLIVKRSKSAKMSKNCRAGPCHASRAVPDNPVPCRAEKLRAFRAVPCRGHPDILLLVRGAKPAQHIKTGPSSQRAEMI